MPRRMIPATGSDPGWQHPGRRPLPDRSRGPTHPAAQRIRSRLLHHRLDRRDVRRERTQRLLNRLLIANISQHLIEHRKLRFGGRYRQARVRHQREQPDRLHRYRLAAGVRAADEQNSLRAIERQRHRDDTLLLPPQHVLQQRMARLASTSLGVRRQGQTSGSHNRNRPRTLLSQTADPTR